MRPQSKSVLVVDDEDIVRMVAASYLEEWGFDVREAASAQEALKLLCQNPDVALLLTDYRMPGMNGLELARAAVARHPHLKVVLLSGYVDTINETLWPILAKPYKEEDLMRLVENELRA